MTPKVEQSDVCAKWWIKHRASEKCKETDSHYHCGPTETLQEMEMRFEGGKQV